MNTFSNFFTGFLSPGFLSDGIFSPGFIWPGFISRNSFSFLSIANLVLFILFCLFCFYRIFVYLLLFQQSEYKTFWFLKYFFKHRWFDKKLSLGLITIAILNFVFKIDIFSQFFVLFPICLYFEIKNLKSFKKKLVWTNRLIRTCSFAVLICLFVFVLNLDGFHNSINILFFVQFLPISVLLGNFFAIPIELFIQSKIAKRAQQKLISLKKEGLIVIGITGSYGKTTLKHILFHIISGEMKTLITPGSINTLMGISRIILEQLNSRFNCFIVEMGAYGRGSISKLCEFAKPDYGIVHSIGNVHIERFKSIENIAIAKFEMFDFVSKFSTSQENYILNLDLIPENIKIPFYSGKKFQTISSNFAKNPDFLIQNQTQTANGLSFEIKHKNETFLIETCLFGEYQIANLASAFVFCFLLKISTAKLLAYFKTIPQITHRLEVKHLSNDIILIDNAYNSNSKSFEAGLQLLNFFCKENKTKRRILVTPGIVELGEMEVSEHERLGILSAQMTDLTLLVNYKRIPSFISGFKRSQNESKLLLFETFSEAKSWLDKNSQPKDCILYENDLTDFYETKINF